MRAGLLVVVALVLVPGVVRAEDRAPFKLKYAVAEDVEGCPDEQGLRANVAARLGYDPFNVDGTRTISLKIQRDSSRLKGRIELRDAAGKLRGVRELEGSTCSDLSASSAFAMAVAIDPERASAPRTDPPPAPPASPPTKEPPPGPATPPAAPAPMQPAPSAPSHSVPIVPSIYLALFGAAVGPYASVAAGAGAGARLRWGAFGAGLEARATLPSSADASTGRVRTNLMGAMPSVCAHVSDAGFCATSFLGAFQGASEGIDAPDKKTTFFASLGLRVHYTWSPVAASGFGLEPYLGADAVLTRTRVNFRGKEVWSTEAVSAELGLRVVYAFR